MESKMSSPRVTPFISILVIIVFMSIFNSIQCNEPFRGFIGGLVTAEDPTTDDSLPELLPSPMPLTSQPRPVEPVLPTVTVRGFLNFRTTVDGTVIVFTPSTAAATAPATKAVTSPSVHSFMGQIASSSVKPFHYQTPSLRSSAFNLNQFSSSIKPSIASVHPTPTWKPPVMVVSSTRPPSPSSSVHYPTGVVTVYKDTQTHGVSTIVHETKVIGTYIDGKYAQILKSTSNVMTPVVVTPTKSFTRSFFVPTVKPSITDSNTGESHHHPVFDTNNSIKEGEPNNSAVTRFTRGDTDITAKVDPNEPNVTRVKIRRPGRLAGNGNGRFTLQSRVTPKQRLNRFKVKLSANPNLPATDSATRFTAKDEHEKEAAKVLNQRLNRRLGVTRTLIPTPAVITTDPVVTFQGSSSSMYNHPLMEGVFVSDPGTSSSDSMNPSRVVTETQTYVTHITRFEAGEPVVEPTTVTQTIERTLDPNEVTASFAPLDSPISFFQGGLIEGTPPIIITKTYTVTDSSTRTSLVPMTEGTFTTTHTITEQFIIHKLITAFKTIPSGASAMLQTVMAEMNNSNYADNLIGSENVIEPTSLSAHVDITPTQSPMKAYSDHMNLPLPSPPPLAPSFNGNNLDLNNPVVLGAALQNPALAAMYFGLQQLSQQATTLTTIYKPTEYLTTEVIYTTKPVTFTDGRVVRTRMMSEPVSTISKVVQTVVAEVTQAVNPQAFVQQAQLQRQFAAQVANQLNQNQQNQNRSPQSMAHNPFFSQMSQLQQSPSNQNQNNNNQNNNNNNNNLFQQQNPFTQQNPFNQMAPSIVVETQTNPTTATATSTKVYTLIYNALSTKFRTVTSTSLYPTTVTSFVTRTVQPTAFNFFG